MIKNILAVAILVALGACSSSDSDGNATPAQGTGGEAGAGGEVATGGQTGTGGAGTPPVGPTGGNEVPADGTKAGSYTGNFGGAEGVYVINNENELAGLAIAADGKAQSLFGDVGDADTFNGSLRQYIHQESRGDGGVGSFGAVASPANDLPIDVTIVNGQTITSTAESDTAVSLAAVIEGSAVSPATVAALAGTWQGVHSFCEDNAAGQPINCQSLTTELVISGTTVTGSTLVTDAAGAPGSPVLISGGISEFGGASLIDFTWGDSPGYSGVIFFPPSGGGSVAFVGENPANTGAPTISALMNKQP